MEVLVQCSPDVRGVTVGVVRSADGDELLEVSYSRSSNTLTVDHQRANALYPSALVQSAPHAIGAPAGFELRVFVDGGLVQTFLDVATVVTSLANFSAVRSPPSDRGVAVETNGGDTASGGQCDVRVWALAL